jgi:hypothetical protein
MRNIYVNYGSRFKIIRDAVGDEFAQASAPATCNVEVEDAVFQCSSRNGVTVGLDIRESGMLSHKHLE